VFQSIRFCEEPLASITAKPLRPLNRVVQRLDRRSTVRSPH
jgi:hypothetical protein